MVWNHRVLASYDKLDKCTYYAIHEVFYDEGKPFMWTEEAERVDYEESIKGVEQTLHWMLDALKKPVLKIEGDKLIEIT